MQSLNSLFSNDSIITPFKKKKKKSFIEIHAIQVNNLNCTNSVGSGIVTELWIHWQNFRTFLSPPKETVPGIPWSRDYDSMLPLQGPWVPSLGRELRCHKAKQQKQTKNSIVINSDSQVPPNPDSHHQPQATNLLACSGHFTLMEFFNMWPFMTSFFHLT